jgi:NAD(P)-dependent dehydrogenase (short-subunit alcohol dehydrogenase family)
LSGKTVLVTGAAGSLGSALSTRLARSGLNTIMLDSDQRGLEAAWDRISGAGWAEPFLLPLDLATAGPEQYEEMIEAIEKEFGGLDSLIHCAARFDGLVPLEHFAPSDWLMHIQVNLNAAWLLSTHCLALLRKSSAAHLYFLLEDLDRVEGAFWGAYGVSKHALRALVSQFSAELKSTPIQVLGINPGPMNSPLRTRAYHTEHPEAQAKPEQVAERIMELIAGARDVQGVIANLTEG